MSDTNINLLRLYTKPDSNATIRLNMSAPMTPSHTTTVSNHQPILCRPQQQPQHRATTTTTTTNHQNVNKHNNKRLLSTVMAMMALNRPQRHLPNQRKQQQQMNNYRPPKQAGYNNRAQAFLSRGAQAIIRMRGLPFTCSAQQVVEFFGRGDPRCQVLGDEEGVLFVKNHDEKPTGDAFVLFANDEAAQLALAKHRENIGARYVELFRSSISEVQQVLSMSGAQIGQSMPQPSQGQTQIARKQSPHQPSQLQARRSGQPIASTGWQSKAREATYAQVATTSYLQAANRGAQQPPNSSRSSSSGAFDANSLNSTSSSLASAPNSVELVVEGADAGKVEAGAEQSLSSSSFEASGSQSPISSPSSTSYKSSSSSSSASHHQLSHQPAHEPQPHSSDSAPASTLAPHYQYQPHPHPHPVSADPHLNQFTAAPCSPQVPYGSPPALFAGSPHQYLAQRPFHHQQHHHHQMAYAAQMAAYSCLFYPAPAHPSGHHQAYACPPKPASGRQETNQPVPALHRRDCIRLRGLPFEASIEDVLCFLAEQSKNILYQGVHMVYSAQGQPTGEAIIQMNSCTAAQQTAQEFHRKVMTVGKKQRYIEVIPSSIEDMNLMLGGQLRPMAPIHPHQPAYYAYPAQPDLAGNMFYVAFALKEC